MASVAPFAETLGVVPGYGYEAALFETGETESLACENSNCKRLFRWGPKKMLFEYCAGMDHIPPVRAPSIS